MSAGMWICEPESGKYGMQKYLYITEDCVMQLLIHATSTWAPSQYKDRLIYVWWFPC